MLIVCSYMITNSFKQVFLGCEPVKDHDTNTRFLKQDTLHKYVLTTYLIPLDLNKCKVQHTQSFKLVDIDVSLRRNTFCKQEAHVSQASCQEKKC